MTSSPSIKVRQRTPWWSLTGILLLVLLTLGNAAANMIPYHVPTARELQRAEQAATIETRRERIATLLAEGDRCRASVARELARALVFDGQSASAYADDYARRCGDDPIVRRWGDASIKLSRLRRAVPVARPSRSPSKISDDFDAEHRTADHDKRVSRRTGSTARRFRRALKPKLSLGAAFADR